MKKDHISAEGEGAPGAKRKGSTISGLNAERTRRPQTDASEILSCSFNADISVERLDGRTDGRTVKEPKGNARNYLVPEMSFHDSNCKSNILEENEMQDSQSHAARQLFL